MTGRVSIVLLIEQDATQRVTLARILKTAGYCVIPAGRAHEALETFTTHHVDIALVVANTQPTTSGGPPLLDSLYTIDPRVPVVVLSNGVAIDRPAYEYPNVAVTLIRPFEPADVLVSVERVLSGAFNWPPTEDELEDIQVVDTTAWQTRQAEPPARQPTALPVVMPAITPGITPAMSPARSEAFVAMASTVAMAGTADTPGVPTMDVVRVEPAAPARLVPPRLIVRGLERRPWTYGGRLSERTRRSLTVAATAFCGLALTTMLELRSAPARHAALMDEKVTEVAGPPLLSANHLRVDTMSLVSARRVRPRAITAIIGRRPVTPAPGDAIHNAAPRIVPRIETRTAAARTRPSTPDVTPSPASPSPVDVATPTAVPTAIPTATTTVAPAAAPAVMRSRDDERGIYQVLQQYERAYERLDVNAARAVWPSLDARALARAFDGLKAQALEFSHCRVALELSEAVAICGGRASYVPRVGRQSARTEPREWTFRLRKVDHDWLIAKAEVR